MSWEIDLFLPPVGIQTKYNPSMSGEKRYILTSYYSCSLKEQADYLTAHQSKKVREWLHCKDHKVCPALFPRSHHFTWTPLLWMEKWEYKLALSSDLIELDQSERSNSYEKVSKGKSTLRKHLVFNQTDKCDNTNPVRKGLEDFFLIHLS